MLIKIKKPVKDNLITNIAAVLPFLIIFGISAGVLISFVLNRPDLLLRGSIVAIPGILAAITLHYIYGNSNKKKEYEYSLINLNEDKFIKLFVVFYLTSIISLIIYPTRPLSYFGIILLLYSIIFIQIFTKSSSTYPVLFEIYLMLLNIIYSVTLKYPLYFGGTDILGHMFYSEVTYLSGHTIPMDLDAAYADFPLLHILVSEVSHLIGSSIQSSYFLITAPIFAASVFFVYLIMLHVSDDRRVSLLSSLVFSSLSVTIYSGMYVVTRTMAFFGFIVILYLIYNKYSESSPIFRVLGLLFGLFVILVHQVSITQIIVVLLFILVIERIVSKLNPDQHKYMSQTFVLFLLVAFIAYWFYVSYAFTEAVVSRFFDSTNYQSLSMKSTIEAGNQWSFILNNIDYSIVTFLALVGIGGTLYIRKKTYLQVFALVSLLILPLYIPTPLQMFWNTMTFFRFDRFMLLVSPFIAFMMALGITYLMDLFKFKKVNKNYFYIIPLILLSGLIFSSMIAASPESGYGVDSERKYFDSAEMASFNYALNYVPYDSHLYSDYYTRRYIPFEKFSESETLGLPYYNGTFRTYLDLQNLHRIDGYIIWRNEAFMESGLRTRSGTMIDVRPDNLSELNYLNSEFEKKNKIYSNYNVEIFN